MTVVLTGRSLTLDEVVSAARGGEQVELAEEALTAMAPRAPSPPASPSGASPSTGSPPGSACRSGRAQQRDDSGFSWRQIAESRAGVGPLAPPDVVRAAMLVFANQMAGATTCIRPVLAERLVQALNDGERPEVRARGSIGASDLAQMADLAAAVFAGMDLVQGEGLALINSSAFGTGSAALALADAARLLDAADVAAALSLEGFAANLSVLHPAIERARPDPVLARTLARFRELLDGSYLWEEGAARNLQDPLNFRSTAPVQAAARRALEYAGSVVAIELNAAQGNPLVSVEDGTIRSACLYEVVGVSAALDFVRIALATMLLAASERSVKLMDTPWSGLPVGLQEPGSPDLGLSILAITAESLGAEVSDARPAGLVHRHEHRRRGGHRGPRHAPPALGAPAGGAGRRRRGDRRHRAARVGAGRGRARRLAARTRHGSGVRAPPRGRADHAARRHAAGGRRADPRADPLRRARLTDVMVGGRSEA